MRLQVIYLHSVNKGVFTYNEIQPDFLLKDIGPLFSPIMGDEPILSVIQPITINTMLNNTING